MVHFQGKTREDAETLKQSGELLTKLESGQYSWIFQYSNECHYEKVWSRTFWSNAISLECSICKELIIEVQIHSITAPFIYEFFCII